MFVCPNCGANINFDPGKQLLHCDYCESEFPPEAAIQKDDADENTYTEFRESDTSEKGYEEYTTTIYTCKECGGEILANDNTVATFCSYCGASTVLASRVGKERAPEYIIPFQITKQQSAELYKRALNKARFAPQYMKEDATIEKLRGIYMPYWIYDFKENRAVTLRGQKDTRRGDYIYHTHYNINTSVQAEYNGLSSDASSQFSDTLSEAIAPFDFKQAVRFNTSYMSGFYADAADTDPKLYEDHCRSIVTQEIYNRIAKDPAVKGISLKPESLPNLTPERTETRFGYFPVWFMSVRHKDRVSYAVVNGQTGEVATDIPIDYKKYILWSLAWSLPIFAALCLIPVMRPIYLLVASIILSAIGMISLCVQRNQIYVRENNLDDKGLIYKQSKNAGGPQAGQAAIPQPQPVKVKKKGEVNTASTALAIVAAVVGYAFFGAIGAFFLALICSPIIIALTGSKNNKIVDTRPAVKAKAPAGEKFMLCLKPLIGVLIALGVWSMAPSADEYYYIAAVICIVTLLLSIWDLVKGHNRLATRKLPQFDKRGGDES